MIGFVSLEAAERDYGVVIRYPGGPERLVRLPEHYAIDAKPRTHGAPLRPEHLDAVGAAT